MALINEFRKEITAKLAEQLGVGNFMAVPKLSKIVINIGMAEGKSDKKLWEDMEKQLAAICGQKPVRTRAKKAISGFTLRAGDEIGLMVTLRGARMYDFFEKLVSVVLPRMRDFRGLTSSSFDGKGNYSLGFNEQLVFAEINPAEVTKIKGMQVTIATTAGDDKQARKLLMALGMPFKKEK